MKKKSYIPPYMETIEVKTESLLMEASVVNQNSENIDNIEDGGTNADHDDWARIGRRNGLWDEE